MASSAGLPWEAGRGRLGVAVRSGAGVGGGLVNEQDLIASCVAGDRDAQRRLFEQTSARVYRLLLRMTGNPDDASELTQETYVKGLPRLDQFDGRSAVASWFYRIAVNEALQFRRRQRVGAAKLRQTAPNQPNQAPAPATDLRMDMEGALAELPPHDRALLLLRYQEELDYGELAEVFECAEGTVASRLSRARERLRELLRKSYG